MATTEELEAELVRLRQENEQLKATKRTESIRVSEKGGVSAYGLGRFPVTLYPEQWDRLIGRGDEIRTFIQENGARLKWKEQSDDLPRPRAAIPLRKRTGRLRR